MAKSTRRKNASKGRVLSSREVYRGPVFSVTIDQVLEPGGIRARRDIVHHPGSVVILALDESRGQPYVLLGRQYRHAAQSFLWELPAGRVDDGESELAGAKRELLEETGYRAARWRRILKFYASPGFLDETMALYLARDLKAGKAQPEDDELIRRRWVPLSSALLLVLRGTIRDGKTISALFWLAWHESAGKPLR
jgi:ADP-ribose pyrophosphatase